jgi:hypothetical protein
VAVCGLAGFVGWSGFGVGFHEARVLILTRLWAKTPCPHQVRAPLMPLRLGGIVKLLTLVRCCQLVVVAIAAR